MTSLKTEIAKGVFWIAVAKYSGIFISLGVTAILARNISPSAFGTMAIATVIIAFLDIFTDMGIGPAIVQFKNLTERQINSLFMVGAGIGVVLSTGLFVASTPIASYYDDPTLINIVRCLCLCLLFNSLNIVPNGLMLRAKRFKAVALRTLGFQIVCGVIAVYGALQGWGIYALIVTPIITSVGVFAVNYLNYPQKLILHVDFDVVNKIWGYSSFQFLFAFSNYFSRNLDKLIIGKYFSMSQLGYYEKSYRLMQLPLQNITYVVSPVLHPILSSLQDNRHELGCKNQKLLTTLSQISFPVGVALYFCAYEIIMIIFGPAWMPSVPVFQILALSLPLQMLLSTSGALFQAAGKTNHMFYTGVCNTVVTVCGFIFVAIKFRTLNAMAWAWDITLLINFINSYIVMNRVTFKYSLRAFFTAFIPQIINSTITTVFTYYILKTIGFKNIFIEGLFKVSVVGCITILLAYVLKQYSIFSILHTLWEKRQKK